MHQALPALSLTFAISLLAQVPAPPSPPLPVTLQNGTFEDGALGAFPKGWSIPKSSQDAGFRSEIAEDQSQRRSQRNALQVAGDRRVGGYGRFLQ